MKVYPDMLFRIRKRYSSSHAKPSRIVRRSWAIRRKSDRFAGPGVIPPLPRHFHISFNGGMAGWPEGISSTRRHETAQLRIATL